MARAAALLLVLLATPTAAVRRGGTARHAGGSPPYAQDCWKQVPLRTRAEAQAIRLALNALGSNASKVGWPGAGLNKDTFVAFRTVYQSDYAGIECVKDYMFLHGDKFGDGKFSYNQEMVSNVTILHYTDIVAKEDRKEMTHEVCFEFCRTWPEMKFFGIFNGRDCYCTPYYKRMASDSTDCDAPCDGNKGQICGGKFKSSMFGMHRCHDTSRMLLEAMKHAEKAMKDLNTARGAATGTSTAMQTLAVKAQKSLGEAGDPEAADLMQTAKEWSGDLEAAEKSAGTLYDSVKEVTLKGRQLKELKPEDLTSLKVVNSVEGATKRLNTLGPKAQDETDKLKKMVALATPKASSVSEGSAEQYKSVMYFVDKAHEKDPTTCTGAAVAKPIVKASFDGCAHACDSHVHSCVGFSYYDIDDSSLCFLFSKFSEVKYYTKCPSSAFLQQQAPEPLSMGPMACMAKLSSFEGTDLTPSVKCEGCLKKLVKAARCPSIATA